MKGPLTFIILWDDIISPEEKWHKSETAIYELQEKCHN